MGGGEEGIAGGRREDGVRKMMIIIRTLTDFNAVIVIVRNL